MAIGNMLHMIRALVALFMMASFARAMNSSDPIVDLGYASYKGIYNSTEKFVTFTSFLSRTCMVNDLGSALINGMASAMPRRLLESFDFELPKTLN